ncbi:MAG: alcohol dehydrogenase catalytic domain-containing protein [Anaerolineae bacterium]|nr:alcohol dehydrogenase catalytic domain-containing protein [Anaerolineae bacterium]
MKQVVWDGEKLSVVSGELPPLGALEARIKIRMAGICSTDLELTRGYKNFTGVPGHEFVGEVIDGPLPWMGKRVVGEINLGCGQCDMCERGDFSHCRNRKILGMVETSGAFAESIQLPVKNLHVVPDNLLDEEAVFTEPLAAACRITQVHSLHAGHRVVLLGAGRLGMLCAQVIQLTGADLSVVVRRESQAELLASWGIRAVSEEELSPEVVDYVVECTGSPEGFEKALELVRPRGTIILKSTYEGRSNVDLTRVVVNEISVEGSRCGPFDTALRLLSQKLVQVTPLIEAVYPLEEAAQAMEHAARRGALKILLRPQVG